MSIEQKIAEMLAESKKLEEGIKLAGAEGGSDPGTHGAQSGDQSTPGVTADTVKPTKGTPNPDNAKNNVDNEDEAANATSKKSNVANAKAAGGEQAVVKPVKEELTVDVSEDVAALISGEELSEEFKTKAATIFEAAVVTRVKQEVAKLEEEFEAKLEEAAAQNLEGLVEKVDGYLDYVVEQWMAQNEIALERGMKSEILEGFVSGLKGLFEEHYIDIPEEKFDVLGSLEEEVQELSAKLDEQVAANVELNKSISELKRAEIVATVSEGLTDTEVEKFKGLAEELSYEDATTFSGKLTTIRESYFNTKAQSGVTSVVTDSPVETLMEEKKIDPTMAKYMSVLNRK
jgi:hypothetical protein